MKYPPPQTLTDWIRWAERHLKRAKLYYGHGTETALDEAAWLVGHVAGLAPAELEAHLNDAPAPAQLEKIRALVEHRIVTRKPLAYLLKEAWFADLKFYVDERVLVPRSLTGEYILERFQPWVEPDKVRTALDLCTGSGCIAIALAHAFPQARVDATDISDDALAVARINVEAHGLRERVHLIKSDLFEALDGSRYDLIVTNPPYVSRADMESLPAEYRHEPALGLAAGEHGLDIVVRILAQAADHLNADGLLVAEVGNSHAALAAVFPEIPFLWLTNAAGDESVFLLTAAQLAQHRPSFAAMT
ncbi:MAG: ribosomal protein L3 N(5)-glutamine methyltransferase [Candidatus Muproteobacteria bacterium RBG_16_64_10]|uniref:Ribosomal protein L3 N(5)-glutamine methyltransferase n=1 Tax=Candidatus Muproteobacteria bacterium RBG_16_64_10 TaxID=1817757 RepID=A0A1F6T789_9PROT|nr:MAG: ribosomal protein L3 N(5)-glutamine methyltransferase [Candidatus Muproteobacteria bacterium RBG_16_64_10]